MKTETATRSVDSGMLLPFLQPFKVRNFNLLFGEQTISVIGDALYAVALPWLILNNGGSAQELGIVVSAYGIPRAGCTLVGGWLSDRLRPRRLMLIADIIRALLMGLLAVLALLTLGIKTWLEWHQAREFAKAQSILPLGKFLTHAVTQLRPVHPRQPICDFLPVSSLH